MKARTLIWNSLRFRARAHLGVVLGAMVGSAALIGALIVGDSVRETLWERALERLGGADLVLDTRDRFFEVALEERLAAAYKDLTRTNPTAARPTFQSLLRLPAVASRQDGAARANQVQVWGTRDIAANTIWLNDALRDQLSAKVGETVILRIHKPSALSRDAVITPRDEASVALRLQVGRILSAEENGNLNPSASQLTPPNAFVRLDDLAQAAGVGRRANLLLASGIPERSPEFINCLLRASFLPEDGELVLTNHPAVELSTRRIFLDGTIVEAVSSTNSFGMLTYLANLIQAGPRATPYSMITAAGPPYTGPGMKDNEIIINEWLAEDLGVKPGEAVNVSYYIADSGSQLEQATNAFVVSKIVALSGIYADRTLMPEFPGLAKAESTHEWDAGFPLEHKIRDKDEAYWKQYRGTPKAFITLKAGQQLWANRFGTLTAIRWPGGNRDEVYTQLRANLDPAAVGFGFDPARERGLSAANNAQDFGGLFLGFSFFLIAAALILMALLFQFGLEQRTEETGILLALGFTPKRVRRLLLGEGAILSIAAAVLGVLGGIVYARLMLLGLATLWREAAGSEPLGFHVTAQSVITGLLASGIVCALTIAIVLRKQARKPARELLASGGELEAQSGAGAARPSGKALAVGVLCLLGAIALVVSQGSDASPQIFFGAGSLLLLGGLALASAGLAALSGSHALSITGMGVRSATRRRKRSLATVALLASGTFMVIAVNANRLQADADSPGTGGFELIGQSALPIVEDLNTVKGLERFGLNSDELKGVSFVPMRVREGDEASCLNLNRAQQPRLLGVRPELLEQRKAFTFPKFGHWLGLKEQLPDGAVPAIGDENSIKWAMGKKVGDTLDYRDERGNGFKIRIVGAVANSILQGQLLIDEAQFTRRFPSESGYRMFLIETPSNAVSEVSAMLGRAMQDTGMELTPAARRLAHFNAVQNTYLSTFQVLGGIGLLLGSLGLGVVVLRNVLERRGELGLLQAVGYRRRTLQWLVASENLALLVGGLVIGVAAAAFAVMPVARRADLPFGTLAGVIVFGVASAWVATWFAMRGRLIDSLREE